MCVDRCTNIYGWLRVGFICQAVNEIRHLLGDDGISTDDEDLQAHGYSEWSSINIDRLPTAVAYPSCTEDVAKIAKICHKYKVPMSMSVEDEYRMTDNSCTMMLTSKTVPYSGGSSVEGHFSASFGGVSVDFMNMNNIVEFHPEE